MLLYAGVKLRVQQQGEPYYEKAFIYCNYIMCFLIRALLAVVPDGKRLVEYVSSVTCRGVINRKSIDNGR